MGATSVVKNYPGTLSVQQLKERFELDQQDCRYENGNSYSGGIGMLNGLVVEQRTFGTVTEARNYIIETAEKWGPGIAVKAKFFKTQYSTQPLFGGQPYKDPYNRIPRRCYIVNTGPDLVSVCVPADQLTKSEKEKVKKLWNDSTSLQKAVLAEDRDFESLLSKLRDTSLPCPPLASLKAHRSRLAKLKKLNEEAITKLGELDIKLSAKIWEQQTVEDGDVWVVGGIASC